MKNDMQTNPNIDSVCQDAPGEQPQKDSATQSDVILQVEGLKKYFVLDRTLLGKPTSTLKAVDNVSFSLRRGTTIGVVGESGCGKTTLGRTILKLYDSDGGKIVYKGEDITKLSRKNMRKYRTSMQLIFQDPYSSLPPRMTVGSIIAEAVKVHKIVPKNQVSEYVHDIMDKCGLQAQYYDRYPHEFSGGQRQRICIARALAVNPELVICDEPVSALDVSVQAQIINLLKDLQKNMGLTYVFISHDLSVVKYITDEILVMYLGNMMEKGDTDELFDNPLHPYTKALFSAVPVPDPDAKSKRIILEGDIPSPANPPKGCKFHTRCSECMGACKIIEPKYHEVTPGHFVACHLYDDEILANRDKYEIAAQHVEEMEKRKAEIKSEYKLFKKKPAKTPVVEDEKSEGVADTVQNEEVTHVLQDEILQEEVERQKNDNEE
ncbi:MAG: ABC transporter ATP-binding protein [Christensenellales bacterium]